MREGVIDRDVCNPVGNEMINEADVAEGKMERKEFVDEARVPDPVESLFDIEEEENRWHAEMELKGNVGEQSEELVVHREARPEASLVRGEKVVQGEVLMKASSKDFFQDFGEDGGELNRAVGTDRRRRFVRFKEHERFGGFPWRGNESGTKNEGVNVSKEEKQGWRCFADMSVRDGVDAGSGVLLTTDSGEDISWGDWLGEGVIRGKGVLGGGL